MSPHALVTIQTKVTDITFHISLHHFQNLNEVISKVSIMIIKITVSIFTSDGQLALRCLFIYLFVYSRLGTQHVHKI